MKYRADIDGLRAIAIIAVVAFHVGLPGWQGGFAGVDIFFAISGYLIGSLLLAEFATTGRISFSEFYARRVRRILPALSLVLIATVIAAALLLNPVENQKSVMQSALASMLFVANLFFWRTTGGYFDSSAESLPLLHMWSLGVEEQWYLVFPALLVALLTLLARFGQSKDQAGNLLLILLVLCLASFALCVVGTAQQPRATFFLLPTRAWEFLLGVCTAVVLRRGYAPGATLSQGLSLLGLGGILLSVLWLEEGHDFPGAVAALPIVSTCLLIVAGTHQSSVAYRFLSQPFMRWIGRVSYSWYLWHWPLLVFPRVLNFGEKNLLMDILFGGLLSLALAELTYRYVEQPARHARGRLMGNGALAGLAMIGTVSLISLVGWFYAGKLEQQPKFRALVAASSANQQSAKSEYRRCMAKYQSQVPEKLSSDGCLFGDPAARSPRVVLWGDSHSVTFAPLLTAMAMQDGYSYLLRARGSCPPVAGLRSVTPDGTTDQLCGTFRERVYAEILSQDFPEVQSVILTARWAQLLADRAGQPPSPTSMVLSEAGLPLVRQDALDKVQKELEMFSDALAKRGIRLLLISPTPELLHSAPQCLGRRSVEVCSIDRGSAEYFTKDFRAMFVRLAANQPNVRVWDALPTLCADDTCPVVRDGVVMYSDTHHLTFDGALSLKPFLGSSDAYRWLLAQ